MVKLFTHTDLDGIGCAVLSKIAYGPNVDITYCNYNDINESVLKGIDGYKGKVFITDISVNFEVAKVLDSLETVDCKLFDHHQTALDLNNFIWADVRVGGVCGTSLFYQYLCKEDRISDAISDKVHDFVRLVTYYDTWAWTKIDTGYRSKELNDLFAIYGRDRFIEWAVDMLMSFDGNTVEFSDAERLVLKLHREEADRYIDSKSKFFNKTTVDGNEVAVVFAEKLAGEIATKILEQYSEVDVVAVIRLSGNVSLRSRDNGVDVAKLAEKFGGGGHPQASGFTYDTKYVKIFINSIFE